MTVSIALARTLAENNRVRADLLRDGLDPDDLTRPGQWVRPMVQVLDPADTDDCHCLDAARWPVPFPSADLDWPLGRVSTEEEQTQAFEWSPRRASVVVTATRDMAQALRRLGLAAEAVRNEWPAAARHTIIAPRPEGHR